MNSHQQPQQENTKGLEMVLFGVGVIIAWPALVVGAVVRWQIKRHTTKPYPYWIAGALGALGTLWLATRANPYPLLLVVLHDLGPLFAQMSTTTFMNVLRDVLPLWERSLLVSPWCTLLLELFGTKSLQATLLAQEHQRRAIQAKKSQDAARKAAKAPDQINGKAVLGALIDNLKEE